MYLGSGIIPRPAAGIAVLADAAHHPAGARVRPLPGGDVSSRGRQPAVLLPSPLLGTFGAFIKVRSPIYSKRALFDIGVSGPIAGFIFLLPALSIGLAFSKVIPGIATRAC
jgi:hypothetical protein